MEEQLLAGGEVAQEAIFNYLIFCSSGKESAGWWSQARRLVKLIARFDLSPDSKAEQLLTQLQEKPSNIWEYETQVKHVALALQEDEKLKKDPVPVATVEKINRFLPPEQRELMGIEAPLKTYECRGLETSITVTEKGVFLLNSYFIPFEDIQEVVLLRVLEDAPACGGCLKLVTQDSPDIPIRDWHSFHMPGQDTAKGMRLPTENGFWYNCTMPGLCKATNESVEEIKALIESRI
jgi:hypothetical protein